MEMCVRERRQIGYTSPSILLAVVVHMCYFWFTWIRTSAIEERNIQFPSTRYLSHCTIIM